MAAKKKTSSGGTVSLRDKRGERKSKAAFVRSFGLGASPHAILREGARQGYALTINRIYAVRTVMRQERTRARDEAPSSRSGTRAAVDPRKVRELRRLIDVLGTQKAQQILDTLERRIERLLAK